MSISLLLLPVALAASPALLAMRVVMGREQFAAWLHSSQKLIPANFASEQQLCDVLHAAGYDATPWGGLLKTHLRADKLFCFWQLIDGVWTAVFSKNDPEDEIEAFLRDLEQKTGRKLFLDAAKSPADAAANVQVFATTFRDGALLTKTLSDYGLNPATRPDGTILCEDVACRLTFAPQGNGPYSVKVQTTGDGARAVDRLQDLQAEYGKAVQAQTYERLKTRIAEKGLAVEQEEVLEDNSIVLTLNIRH